MKQEMDQDLDRLEDTSGEINPYHKIIVNKAERCDTILSQMEQWSILSNVVNYVQCDRHPKNFYNLDIKALDQKKIHKKIHDQEEEGQMLDLDFVDTAEKFEREYLNIY